jgi:hypothetical protein
MNSNTVLFTLDYNRSGVTRIFYLLASRRYQCNINIVGTLKLGYPLLLYKDEEPTRLSLSRVVEVLCVGPSHSSPQSQAAILGPQQRPTPPHGAGPKPPHVQRR